MTSPNYNPYMSTPPQTPTSTSLSNFQLCERVYIKLTNKKENHFGFQYYDGMNTLIQPFNDDPEDSCGPGGLYVTTNEHAPGHITHDTRWIRVVYLPRWLPDFKYVPDPSGNKLRANKLFLSTRYSIFDVDAYTYLGIDIHRLKDRLLSLACEQGRVDVLENFKNRGLIQLFNAQIEFLVRRAMRDYHTAVVRWFARNWYIGNHTTTFGREVDSYLLKFGMW